MRMSIQLNFGSGSSSMSLCYTSRFANSTVSCFFRPCINGSDISYLVYENDDIAAHVTRERRELF